MCVAGPSAVMNGDHPGPSDEDEPEEDEEDEELLRAGRVGSPGSAGSRGSRGSAPPHLHDHDSMDSERGGALNLVSISRNYEEISFDDKIIIWSVLIDLQNVEQTSGFYGHRSLGEWVTGQP